MKFIVRRTSGHDESNKPCEEAFEGSYLHVDERTVDDPSKLNFGRKKWYQQGTNHRVENGHIKRDFEMEGWLININSLDELIAFAKKYGDLVIDNDYLIPRIEIYDDYRE